MLLLEAIRGLGSLRGRRCLDLGTGTGLLAAEMARMGCFTVASDLNFGACELARRNMELNGMRAEVVNADLTSCFREGSFDLIAFNPPYLPVQLESEQWSGGALGRELIDRLLKELPRVLRRGGSALILHADFNMPELTIEFAGELELEARILRRRKLAFHELIVIELMRTVTP